MKKDRMDVNRREQGEAAYSGTGERWIEGRKRAKTTSERIRGEKRHLK